MAKLHRVYDNGKDNRWAFWCPGCGESHYVIVPPATNAWQWNGSVDVPSLIPSILTGQGHDFNEKRCHSFIREGQIQFLGDCHHKLAGQTVPLPDWEARVHGEST